MIRVLIQVVPPPGRSRGAQTIARIDIANESPVDARWADYTVRCAVERPNGDSGTHTRLVRGHDRRAWNVLGLVMRALEELGHRAMRSGYDGELDLPPGQ